MNQTGRPLVGSPSAFSAGRYDSRFDPEGIAWVGGKVIAVSEFGVISVFDP